MFVELKELSGQSSTHLEATQSGNLCVQINKVFTSVKKKQSQTKTVIMLQHASEVHFKSLSCALRSQRESYRDKHVVTYFLLTVAKWIIMFSLLSICTHILWLFAHFLNLFAHFTNLILISLNNLSICLHMILSICTHILRLYWHILCICTYIFSLFAH